MQRVGGPSTESVIRCNQTQLNAKSLTELQNLYSAVRICPAPLREVVVIERYLVCSHFLSSPRLCRHD